MKTIRRFKTILVRVRIRLSLILFPCRAEIAFGKAEIFLGTNEPLATCGGSVGSLSTGEIGFIKCVRGKQHCDLCPRFHALWQTLTTWSASDENLHVEAIGAHSEPNSINGHREITKIGNLDCAPLDAHDGNNPYKPHPKSNRISAKRMPRIKNPKTGSKQTKGKSSNRGD